MSVYSSDTAREQFEIIRPFFETKKRTNPRDLDLYKVFCAILCLLETAATWMDLPDSFPKWSAACCYFGSWPEKGGSGKSATNKAPCELMLGERIIN
ncbi:MAG: transposase [Clostridiales bacterium]|nr:transposase [Clostridiales bacterium]